MGAAVSVRLDSARLIGPATLTFDVPSGWPSTLVPVVVWEDGTGGWRWLPSAGWAAGATKLAVKTDHFSNGALFGVDVQKLASSWVDALRNLVIGRAGASRPSWQAEAQTQQQVQVSAPDADAVLWCLGTENGRVVLKLTNNRRIDTQVAYPSTWSVLSGSEFGLSLDALLRSVGQGIEQLPYTKRGMTVRFVEPGKTLVLAVPAGAGATVEAKASAVSYYLQNLQVGLDEWTAVGGGAGLKSDPTLARFVDAIALQQKNTWGNAVRDCLKDFTSNVTGDLTAAVTTRDQFFGVGKFALTCGAALGKADLVSSGAVLWLISGVIDTVTSVLTIAYTLVNQLSVGLREVWDGVATLTGHGGNPIYILTIASRPPPPGLALYFPTPGSASQSHNRAPLRITLAPRTAPAAIGIRYSGKVWPVTPVAGQSVYDVYVTGLTDGTPYNFIAEVCGKGSLCATSAPVTFTPYELPTAGTVTATASGRSLVVRFTAMDLHFNPQTGFRCSLAVTVPPASTWSPDSGLPPPQAVGTSASAGSATVPVPQAGTYAVTKVCTNSFTTVLARSGAVTVR